MLLEKEKLIFIFVFYLIFLRYLEFIKFRMRRGNTCLLGIYCIFVVVVDYEEVGGLLYCFYF